MRMRRHIQGRAAFALALCGALLILGSFASDAAPPSPPEGLVALAQPASIPAFSLVDINGTTVRSTDLQGKVVVVRFWATW
jgi:cytochrome oxidase Cu insertion factor (SCO1/SenC/PrrC family)